MRKRYEETMAPVATRCSGNNSIARRRWRRVLYVSICLAWPAYALAGDQPSSVKCDIEKTGAIHLSSPDEKDTITATLKGRDCQDGRIKVSITRYDGKGIFQRLVSVRDLIPETSGPPTEKEVARMLEEIVGGDVVQLPDIKQFESSVQYDLFVSERRYEELRKSKTLAYAIDIHYTRRSFIYYVSKKETVYEIIRVDF